MNRSYPAWLAALGLLLLVAPASAEQEPAAPDVRPEALKDFRQSHPFKTLDNPKMVAPADAAFLRDDDYVLAVTIQGQSRAYPTRFMGWHHGVNDRVGDVPFAVTYCNVCNTAIGYDLRLDGKTVALDFHGLYNAVVALRDRETGSAFLQVDGRFVNGPLSGKRLKTVPVIDISWGAWKKLHPDTTVMSPENGFSQNYRLPPGPEPRDRDRLAPFFIETITRGDLRLSPFEKVMGLAVSLPGGVTSQTAYRAYPLQAVWEAGGVLNDTAEGKPVAVFVQPGTQAAVAVSRTLEGRTLTFEGRKDDAGAFTITDKETGSRWSVEGKAESGPLSGKSLDRFVTHISLWYGWAAYFPETTIYGRTDPAKPGNPFTTAPAGEKP